MQLVACARCNRHIRESATRCPFCDAVRDRHLISRVIDTGARLSRAAVFAGAAACYTSPPPPQGPPPPPPDNTVPTDTTGTGTFAQPPPDGGSSTTAQALGVIDGVARDGGMQAPIPHAMITLVGTGLQLHTTADDRGRFAFHDLPAGQYQIVLQDPGGNPRQPPPARIVQLAAGGTEHVILNKPPYVPDRGPCCKPYGAPPARRRVV